MGLYNLITPKTACERLDISKMTLRQWEKKKKLRPVFVDGVKFFRELAVEKLIGTKRMTGPRR